MGTVESGAAAFCPECGALVPLVHGRWLQVHRHGSAEYAYPRGQAHRCSGSLLPAEGLVAGPGPAPRATPA